MNKITRASDMNYDSTFINGKNYLANKERLTLCLALAKRTYNIALRIRVTDEGIFIDDIKTGKELAGLKNFGVNEYEHGEHWFTCGGKQVQYNVDKLIYKEAQLSRLISE